MKLTNQEKEHVAKVIEQACMGTQLQGNAEFVGGYLGFIVVGLIENWDIVSLSLRDEAPTIPASDEPVPHGVLIRCQMCRRVFAVSAETYQQGLPVKCVHCGSTSTHESL
jgi:hypothetical protein